MSRIRTIKPEFWEDEKLAKVSRDARLLFVATWNHADDYGVFRASPAYLKARVFPYDDLTHTDLARLLEELSRGGFVRVFRTGDEQWGHIRHWDKHQRVDHPSKIRNPLPPLDDAVGSLNPRESVASPPEALAPYQDLVPGPGPGKEVADAEQPAPPPVKAPRAKKPKPPPGPGWTELVAGLVEDYEVVFPGTEYQFGPSDGIQLSKLRRTVPDDIIRVVWRYALNSSVFPKCRNVRALVQHFNHLQPSALSHDGQSKVHMLHVDRPRSA